MENKPWHVLHVLSNHERRVAQHLAVRSVEHYLPLYSERVKWTDRTMTTERPLFSGYVFARFIPQARILAVSTPGVVRVLGDEERDLVSNEELEKIRCGLAGGLVLRPHLSVPVGTRVRVQAGVFAGAEGVVVNLRQQCRVVLSLSAAHQCFSLEVDLKSLKILEPPAAKLQSSQIPAFR